MDLMQNWFLNYVKRDLCLTGFAQGSPWQAWPIGPLARLLAAQ